MEDCLFCNIVNGKTDTELLVDNEVLAVFKDINPKAPIHLLLVPKKHIESVNNLTEEDCKIISDLILQAKKTAKDFSTENGYKLIFNVGKRGGQIIGHIHLHLLGGL